MNHLIDELHRTGLLDAESSQRARTMIATGKAFEDAVLAADGLSEDALLRHLAEQLDIPYVDLDKQAPDKDFLKKFPTRVLVRNTILPIAEKDGVVIVAASRATTSAAALDELRLVSGRDCTLALAPAAEIERTLKQLLGVGADTLQSLEPTGGIQVLESEDDNDLDVTGDANDASIIKFVNQVLVEAIESRATDVHIEPFEDALRLRNRIDGVLVESPVPPNLRRFHAAIVSRLKIIAHLDIAEKRLPQDGRIKLKLAGREIDVRVSIIPMIHGEAVVLRILHRSTALLGTEHLGMAARDRAIFDEVLEMPHGIVLVTGPTGSGKTTTLYAALGKINDVQRKIVTIEDPVEYQLRGVNQIQVNTKSGLTFAAGLRAILRHDPDVVLVGEIRDRETAEIAVQASLTGHLVMSTLHTNTAIGAITRMRDMGIEPFLLSSSLLAVLAQRLVRTLCPDCRAPHPISEQERIAMGIELAPDQQMWRPVGCEQCNHTGYRGRTGIHELVVIDEAVREAIHSASGELAIERLIRGHTPSIRRDGIDKVLQGQTSLEEVLRVTRED